MRDCDRVQRLEETVLVTVEARREQDLVEAFLRRVIQECAASGPDRGEPVGMIGFRATAGNLAGILGAAIDAAFGEAETQGFAILDAEVSGVMATDDGVRCWGMVEVASAVSPSSTPRLHGIPTVRRDGTLFIAEVSLDVEEGNP